jgi:hypothetical protein
MVKEGMIGLMAVLMKANGLTIKCTEKVDMNGMVLILLRWKIL